MINVENINSLPLILSEDEEVEISEYYNNVHISFWRDIVLNG
jgi:hypothetical protein